MTMRAAVAAVGLVVAVTGCGPTPGADHAGTPSAGPSSASSAAGPIVYVKSWSRDGVPKGGVEVTKPSELVRLTGAPPDFIDFVGDELATLKAQDGSVEGCGSSVINVEGIDPTVGVAVGAEASACEGAEALWIRWNGRWLMAEGTQAGWPCDELKKFLVPTAIVGPNCISSDTKEFQTERYTGPTPVPVRQGTPGRHVVYMSTLDANSHGADGVRIKVENDPAPLLKDAPSAFVDVIDEQRSEGCDLMIDGIDPKIGIATGSAMNCDNARAIIWIRWNGRWMEVASSSDRWPCYELASYRVPADLTGNTCSEWNDHGDEQVVAYKPPAA